MLKAGFPMWRSTRGILTDLRVASRRLYATPFFTIFAVLSLAVGVGVTTAVYSVVDAIFLRDLGIPCSRPRRPPPAWSRMIFAAW